MAMSSLRLRLALNLKLRSVAAVSFARRWPGTRCTAGHADARHATSSTNEQLILGIESSCDETGAAVVSTTRGLLGEALASQTESHAKHGGVVPDLARDLHVAAMDDVVAEALRDANVSPEQLTAVAVTIGPGLSLCLKVGVAKATKLAHQYQLSFIPVHHMEAHALVARMPLHDDDAQGGHLRVIVRRAQLPAGAVARPGVVRGGRVQCARLQLGVAAAVRRRQSIRPGADPAAVPAPAPRRPDLDRRDAGVAGAVARGKGTRSLARGKALGRF